LDLKRKTVLVLLFATLIASSITVIPIESQGNNNPNKWLGEPTFVLNILGKKDDWNPSGDFSNPDRHTIFVPESGGTTLWITQAPRNSLYPFAVLDGNGFDDDGASLQLGDGYFAVFVVALGKPVTGDSYLNGFATDPYGTPLLQIGLVDSNVLKPHGKQPVWGNFTHIFYITYDQIVEYLTGIGDLDPTGNATKIINFFASLPGAYFIPDLDGDPLTYDPAIWIFDFFDYLVEVAGMTEGQYYWELKNNGNKHLQVRFYQVSYRTWTLLGGS